MFVCVVSLSQMLYVKCLSVLSRYLRCYMLNVLSRLLSPVVEVWERNVKRKLVVE